MMQSWITATLSVILLTSQYHAAAAFQSAFVGKSVSVRASQRNSDTALCMKTIAVFGASGLTASECVYQALENGDKVVGLTRYVE